MSKTRYTSAPAVGASSLLVVFAVLILLVFALLSLSTVQADSQLSDASAQAVSNYYAADYQANLILAQLRQGQRPDGVSSDGDEYAYSCAIDENQSLFVRLRLAADGNYTILLWQVIYSGQWQTNDQLHVWDGSTDTWPQ